MFKILKVLTMYSMAMGAIIFLSMPAQAYKGVSMDKVECDVDLNYEIESSGIRDKSQRCVIGGGYHARSFNMDNAFSGREHAGVARWDDEAARKLCEQRALQAFKYRFGSDYRAKAESCGIRNEKFSTMSAL